MLGRGREWRPVFPGSTSSPEPVQKSQLCNLPGHSPPASEASLVTRPGTEMAVACTRQVWPPAATFHVGTGCFADKHLGTRRVWEGAKNSTAGNREAFSKSSGSCYPPTMGQRDPNGWHLHKGLCLEQAQNRGDPDHVKSHSGQSKGISALWDWAWRGRGWGCLYNLTAPVGSLWPLPL